MKDQEESFDMINEAVAATAKSLPPVAVVSMSLAGMPLQEWVYIFTLVWLFVQITTTLWKFFRDKGRPERRRK